jgi:hypothetical protein
MLHCGCCDDHQVHVPRTGILFTSKRIHEEAKRAFFQTNEFLFFIEIDCSSPANRSIMGLRGWNFAVGRYEPYRSRELGRQAFYLKPPLDMIPFMRHVQVVVGPHGGFIEQHIVPIVELAGPERPQYNRLLDMIEEVAQLLRSCRHIHSFRLSIRSSERLPGSTQKLLEPFLRLRGIKNSSFTVWSIQPCKWVYWTIRPCFARYLREVVSLPEGVKAPDYVSDDDVSTVPSDDSLCGSPSEEVWYHEVDYLNERWRANAVDAVPGDADFDYDAGVEEEQPGYFTSESNIADDWIDYVSDEDVDVFSMREGLFEDILPEQFLA